MNDQDNTLPPNPPANLPPTDPNQALNTTPPVSTIPEQNPATTIPPIQPISQSPLENVLGYNTTQPTPLPTFDQSAISNPTQSMGDLNPNITPSMPANPEPTLTTFTNTDLPQTVQPNIASGIVSPVTLPEPSQPIIPPDTPPALPPLMTSQTPSIPSTETPTPAPINPIPTWPPQSVEPASNLTPVTPQQTPPNPAPPTIPEPAPTDLSQLIANTPPPLQPVYPASTPANNLSLPQSTPQIPSTSNSIKKSPTKILIVSGAILTLLVTGLSIYFFFLTGSSNKSTSSSTPAVKEDSQLPLTNPPKQIVKPAPSLETNQASASTSAETSDGNESIENTSEEDNPSSQASTKPASALETLKKRQASQ